MTGRPKDRARGDASAAFGILRRSGVGKVRHIDIGILWIHQEWVREIPQFENIMGNREPHRYVH